MAYEDIYKGLTEEERQRMIKADIPKFEITGEVDLTEEELRQAEEQLQRFIRLGERARREKRDIPLTENELSYGE